MLGENFVPGALSKADDNAKNIFKSTFLETKPNEHGVVIPKYPSPISIEGVLHTLIDRMSQGSQGGMLKIYSELGNSPANALEMLRGNPEKTLIQLEALKKHSQTLKISDKEKSELSQVIASGVKRLQRQNQFLNQKIQKDDAGNGFTLTLDSGEKVHVDDKSDPDKVKALIEKVTNEEQQRNGDPMLGFNIPKKDARMLFVPIPACGSSGNPNRSINNFQNEKYRLPTKANQLDQR